MTTDLTTKQKSEISAFDKNEFTIDDIKNQVVLIQNIMQAVMIKDEHYGIIPGCKKPSLYKPGAEKLLLTFRLNPDYQTIESKKDKDFIYYQIKCTLKHINSGKEIASGMGSCNSREAKFKHSDCWTMDNTLLKMACKRALVAAVLNGTAASDIFTQDVEDIQEHVNGNSKKPEPKNITPDIITPAQLKRLFTICSESKIENEEAKQIIKNHGYESSKDIKQADYDKVIKDIEDLIEMKKTMMEVEAANA